MGRSAGIVMLVVLAAMASISGAIAVRDGGTAENPATVPPRGMTKIRVEDFASTCENGPKRAFADYLGKAEQDLGWDLDKERLRAPALKLAGFRTVVVTIPDPVDSRLDAGFDETLTALGHAAATLEYALDRYWLPWQLDRRQREADRLPDDCRTRQPGVILYRPSPGSQARENTGGQRPPLAFLLVGETATTGIHRVALGRALEIVEAAGEKRSARVLGPSFSGTAHSLGRELSCQRYDGWIFKIITGSATAKEALNNSLDKQKPGAATFLLQLTVHTDDDMWATLTEFLHYLHIELADVAVLIESDTVYGAESSTFAHSESEAFATKQPPRTVIRFPMQVSRIRSDYERQRVRQNLTIGGYQLPPEALELRADTNHDPKDVLPALSSASENYEEEVLAADLGSLRKHPVRAVGVLATDPLDKAFLVSKLRELAPDLLVFTLESSLLFLHPDVRRAMYGSLVVSTYPLFVEAQSWTATGPLHERIQFASSAAEGIYNAAILLIAEAERAGHERAGHQLLDYECPFPARFPSVSYPPVWISVVGQDALWPVWTRGCENGKPPRADVPRIVQGPMVWAWGSRFKPLHRLHAPHASRGMLLLAAFVVLFAAANAAAAFAARGLISRHFRHFLRSYVPRLVGSTRPHCAWLMAHLLWLALVTLAMAVILSIPDAAGLDRRVLSPEASLDWTDFMARLAAAVTGLLVVAAGWLGWELARSHRRSDRGASPSRWERLAVGAMACALALAVMLLAPALASFAMRTSERTWTLLLFERAVHLGSGVNPLLPLVFPALVIHLWTHRQLIRIHLLEGQEVGTGDLVFRRFAGADDPVLREADKCLVELTQGRLSLRDWVLALAFAFPAVAVLCYAWYFLHSPDGPGFDRLFVVLLATAIVIAGSSLLRAWRLWWALRTALERLPLDPVGGALKRLPEPFRQRLQRLFFKGPQYEDLQTSYDIFCKAFPPPMWAETHRRIEKCLSEDRRTPLRPRWDHASLAALADAAAASRAGASSCAHVTAMEDFVASQLALKVFWVLAHLRWRVAYSVLSAVAILGAVAFYPFQPHTILMLLIWIVVLGAAVSAVVIYVQHGRNEVLSWLSGTTPGRVSLDAEHLTHFITLGAAPVLALLAFQVPAFGHWLAGWLGPAFGAMK